MGNERKNGLDVFHPVWLLISASLPQAVLLALSLAQFSAMGAPLARPASYWALGFGISLLFLASSCTAYAVSCLTGRRSLNPVICLPLIGAYVPLLYVFSYWFLSGTRFAVGRWLFREYDFFFLALTLGLPCIVYGFVLAAAWRLIKTGRKRSWPSFMISLAVPAAFYLFFMIVVPAVKWGSSSELVMHAVAILCVLSAVVFFFFILRGAYALLIRGRKKILAHEIVFRVLLSLVLPLAGLVLYNAGGSIHLWGYGAGGVLGDFSSPWFYIIATCTGIVLSLPNPGDKRLRLVLFALRAAFLPFSAYFFLVFLPYTPIAPLLMIVAGLGFLLLAPLGLFLVHALQISRDVKAVHASYPAAVTVLAGVIAFLIIPSAIGAGLFRERYALNEVLRYAYEPEYGSNQTARIGGREIGAILDKIETLRESKGTPILSPCFRLIVLDNMTLSRSTLANLRALYGIGKGEYAREGLLVVSDESRRQGMARLSGLEAESVYDEKAAAWVSSVRLEMRNASTPRAEYAAAFALPEGAFINEYHLYIGDRREEGMVMEKRAALWVFQRILRQNRDPGILHILDDGRIGLEVFPFQENETRRTGFTIVHKEPFTLRLDGMQKKLGSTMSVLTAPVEAIRGSGVYYLSAEAKRNLPRARREPYFHFILDCSTAAGPHFAEYRGIVDSFMRGRDVGSARAMVSFVNASVGTADFNCDWETARLPFSGGFFLDRALKKILFDHALLADERYPVIVVVSMNLEEAVFISSMAEFSFACPETGYYFHLNGSGEPRPYSMFLPPTAGAALLSIQAARPQPTVVWRRPGEKPVFLRQDEAPGIVFPLHREARLPDPTRVGSVWEKGALLRAMWSRRAFYPADASESFKDVFHASVSSHILTSAVAFIAVENELQKKALRDKQEETLSGAGAKGKELDDEYMAMSEPRWLVMFAIASALFVVFSCFSRKASGSGPASAGPAGP